MAQITVPQSQAFINYNLPAGAGPNSSWPINFPFFALSDIAVSFIAADGSTGRWNPGTDYTVTGVAADDGYSSGTVLMLVGIGPCTLTVARETPMEKLSNWPTTGAFSIYAENTLWSKHTAWHQQHQRNVARAIRVPMGEGVLSLPGAAKRAKKMLIFDAQGFPALSDADADTIVADAEAAAARAETAANHAATSETNAAVSANSAASSAMAASSSATAANVANTAAQNAASQAAASNAAAGSARDAAAASAVQAANSATTATNQASNALNSAMNAAASETNAAASATAAAGSATAAALSADEAEYWAGQAESLTAPPASETVPGIVEIATQVEVNAGTLDGNYVVTPLKLKTMLAANGGYVAKAGDVMTGALAIGGASTLPTASLYVKSIADSNVRVLAEATAAASIALYRIKTPEGSYDFRTQSGVLQLYDSGASAPRLSIDTASVFTALALGVMRKPTPGQHLHVYYTGDVYACVETDSANIAVLRARTPQSDYGWCANGGVNNLYLWDYKRGVSPIGISATDIQFWQKVGIKTSDFSASQSLHVYDAGYAHAMVNTGTNYWARLSLKNTLRHWDVNVEPGGKFVINDETAGASRLTINTSNGAVYTAGALGVGTDPGHAFHLYSTGFLNAMVQTVGSNEQARIQFQNPQRSFGLGVISNEFQLWDFTSMIKQFAIATDGQAYFFGKINGAAGINITGNGGVSGDMWVGGQVRGGPGDAGQLRSYGSANVIAFRWGSGAGGNGLYMRIDGIEIGKVYTV